MRQSIIDLSVTTVGMLPIIQAPGDANDTHTIVIIRIVGISNYPGEKLSLSQLTNPCTVESMTEQMPNLRMSSFSCEDCVFALTS